MEWRDLLTALNRFGIAEREAKLYLLLLSRGRATARDLTRESNVDRVLTYRTLDAMRARGLVQVTAERPRRYVPLPPRVLFERSLVERRLALEEDAALARELSERLPELTTALTDGAPRFQVITGAAAIYPYLREMVRRAEREVLVMITSKALRESAQLGLFGQLPAFGRRGGHFRLVVEPDPRIANLLRRFAGAQRRFPNAEVRSTTPQRARVTIIDEREALVFLVPDPGVPGVEEIAVWTDTPDFVKAQLAYFRAIWDRSTPALPVPRRSKR
ncbi:MAG: helix-turn-helix domain-containing protein [Thermoplasmata archaeon]